MENNIRVMPTIALRGLVVFPHMQLNFDVGRTPSIKAIEAASNSDSLIFLVAQKKAELEKPKEKDIYRVGTIAKIKQVMHMPGNVTRLIVKGVSRGVLHEFESMDPHISCQVEVIEDSNIHDKTTEEAYCKALKGKLEEYFAVNPKLQPDKFVHIMAIKGLSHLCDTVSALVELDIDIKQSLLNEFDPMKRAEELIVKLEHLIEVTEIEQKIVKKTRDRLDEHQHEYFLREQMQVIQEELGDKDGIGAEAEEFLSKAEKLKIKKEYKEKLIKEINRFSKLPAAGADSGVLRTYLETVFDLPWNNVKKEKFEIQKVIDILHEDHYGLMKVKERILEFLAVRSLTKGKNSTILCLVGPPGVGKTSVAKSIARALDRKYVRVSLGGIHDEADIRGHRKTYIGAMEGRIMSAMREAKVKNPVMLLDEIDKMGVDYKGDPSAALLEVLDNEQNSEFRDHYIEIPFDLSDVLFITTANTLETISQPLLDRLEIIELSGYTGKEKFYIARDYLVKKALSKTGMDEDKFKITDGAINKIIDNYTREAGVRKLEQTVETLIRKAAKVMLETKCKCVTVDEGNIVDFLGHPKYHFDLMNSTDEVGVARGLAWTKVGGETLSVEVNVMEGTGKVELTGKLGDIMKESAMAAISYIRSRAESLGIEKDFYTTKDIHIHVPEGAVPKDGPSAGITIATAVVSSLSGIPVRNDVAMTGEITLRGRVLPIGGLKEKSMAAYRAGFRTIIIPENNVPDIDEVPDEVRNEISYIPVSDMDTVLSNALRKDA